jgi:hypothetical protein
MIIKSDCNSFACFNYFCKLEMCVRKLQFFSNETIDSLQMDLFKDFLLKIKNFDWLIWNFSAHNKLEQIVIGKDVFLKIWNLFRYLWTKNLGRMLLTATVWVKIINDFRMRGFIVSGQITHYFTSKNNNFVSFFSLKFFAWKLIYL